MALSDNIVGRLHIRHQHMPVFDIDPEFSLQGFVNMHTSFDINVTSLVPPVRVE